MPSLDQTLYDAVSAALRDEVAKLNAAYRAKPVEAPRPLDAEEYAGEYADRGFGVNGYNQGS